MFTHRDAHVEEEPTHHGTHPARMSDGAGASERRASAAPAGESPGGTRRAGAEPGGASPLPSPLRGAPMTRVGMWGCRVATQQNPSPN